VTGFPVLQGQHGDFYVQADWLSNFAISFADFLPVMKHHEPPS
jgi:hypothetical protein